MALINPKQISLIAPIDATGPLSASGDVLLVTATGRNTLVVALPASAWSGTILVEGTAYGDFSDATVLSLIPYGGGASLAALTAGGIYELSVTGLSAVRLRATTAITGGPIAALLRAAMGNKSVRVGAPSAQPVPVQRVPLTFTTAFSGALTASWQKVATTTTATKGLRIGIVGAPAPSAYDIEWTTVAAGSAAPTDTYGEGIGGGEDFAAGLPIGDIYLRSASLQVALVKTGA